MNANGFAIGEDELEEALASRAESLVPGVAPADAVLAGARRRGVRRRAAMATAGVLAVTGVAVEVGTLGGGPSGPAAVSPGHATVTGAIGQAGRRVPVVTQQAGLAAGQKQLSAGTVAASGTVDGRPWQLVVTDTPITDTGTYHWTIKLFIAGKVVTSAEGGPSEKGDYGNVSALNPNPDAGGESFDVVDSGVATMLWTGPDGFRQQVPTFPLPFGHRKIAVFPDPLPVILGDTIDEYDASGKKIGTVMHLERPPATPQFSSASQSMSAGSASSAG